MVAPHGEAHLERDRVYSSRVKSSIPNPINGTCDSCGRVVPVLVRTLAGFHVCPECRDELDAHGAELNPEWVKLGKKYTE